MKLEMKLTQLLCMQTTATALEPAVFTVRDKAASKVSKQPIDTEIKKSSSESYRAFQNYSVKHLCMWIHEPYTHTHTQQRD